ncbi:MAG: hypothetical protein ACI9YE_002820 [Psychroserpens sp.]|jgi:hypothetical protein
MKAKSKIERLEEFKQIDFQEMFLEIIKRIGYINVQSYDSEFISADEKSALKTNKHVFFLTIESLSGVEDETLVDHIVEKLKKHSLANDKYSFFIVSTQYISNGFEKKLQNKAEGINVEFKGRDEIILLIDTYYKDFWKHDDRLLIDYENEFISSINEDTDLKKLKIFNEKYDKVLKIFIEPRIYSIKEDPESGKPTRKKMGLVNVCCEGNSKIISGDAGAGKSTLLKKIGETFIDQNREVGVKRNLPIYLTTLDFIESDYDLYKLFRVKLFDHFSADFNELAAIYNIQLLIDSIDEFSSQLQKRIFDQLNDLSEKKLITFILGTRNSEGIKVHQGNQVLDSYHIEKFNQDQIRSYIENFFPGNSNKAESLLDALRDNRILERLPITPLTLSLVSILYEERNFEIPATIADIYDNFNHLLLGKATVSSRIEFIDISFAERILSLYAFELLHRDSHSPMTMDEFFKFFGDYFSEKQSSLAEDNIRKFLTHLTSNSGVLEVKEGKYVQFKHSSFLEYYAAKEYFLHKRAESYENEIVDNFFDPIWQNTAIFYAGMSKDMPEFLEKIITKVSSANIFHQYFSAVNGLGYLLQALYQTDNDIRKKGILQAVETNIESLNLFKKLAQDEQVLFKNYKLPILSLINLTYFYENFNSIALKYPLELCFNEYFEKYKSDKSDENNGYRALKIALTLNSPRLNSIKFIDRLIEETEITSNPYLSLIALFAIDINGSSSSEIKKELKKSLKRNPSAVKEIQESSLRKLRFSPLDNIYPNRKVKLIVEGKTDVQIIEHAYMTLMNGERPYWNISSPKNGGSARSVGDVINAGVTTINVDEFIIGVVDNDSEGISIFNGHIKDLELQSDSRIKKDKDSNVFAIKLPIPQRLAHYHKEKQTLNYFELEHYFPFEYLQENNMLKPSGVADIFEIKGNKSAFTKKVLKETDKTLFNDFIDLFRLIDSITEYDNDY